MCKVNQNELVKMHYLTLLSHLKPQTIICGRGNTILLLTWQSICYQITICSQTCPSLGLRLPRAHPRVYCRSLMYRLRSLSCHRTPASSISLLSYNKLMWTYTSQWGSLTVCRKSYSLLQVMWESVSGSTSHLCYIWMSSDTKIVLVCCP